MRKVCTAHGTGSAGWGMCRADRSTRVGNQHRAGQNDDQALSGSFDGSYPAIRIGHAHA
ncbi:hypothetical protein C7S14_1569 [Burkholderia cepacia]|nr:hypothetical protein C7S14_1569 [Burkholderia cepacia]